MGWCQVCFGIDLSIQMKRNDGQDLLLWYFSVLPWLISCSHCNTVRLVSFIYMIHWNLLVSFPKLSIFYADMTALFHMPHTLSYWHVHSWRPNTNHAFAYPSAALRNFNKMPHQKLSFLFSFFTKSVIIIILMWSENDSNVNIRPAVSQGLPVYHQWVSVYF